MLKHLFFSLLCTFVFASEAWCGIRIGELRCELLKEPLAIDGTQPHFSWQLKSNKKGDGCRGWQILVASTPELLNEKEADLWNSGKISSSLTTGITYCGKALKPKDIAYWKVRVWDNENRPSDWSKPAEFGIGLLSESDWNKEASFIGTIQPKGDKQSAPLFRKVFEYTPQKERVLLYVNSLGYHEAYLNGTAVSDAVLTPAVSELGKRSLIVTYDVTRLVRKGKNELVIWTGKGWYQTHRKNITEGGPFVRAQLEGIHPNASRTLVVTDGSWQTAPSGRTTFGNWNPHQMGGETVDARTTPSDLKPETLQAMEWEPARVVSVEEHVASPQMCEPNRRQNALHPQSVRAAGDSTFIYDLGTNIVGFTKVVMPGVESGKRIELHYDDFFQKKETDFHDGLYTDYYIGSGEKGVPFTSKFNYKGYRYLKIKGLAEALPLKHITAYSVRTDYDGDASFVCSDNDLNAIFDMVKRTLQALTLGGDMVDCPQIERLGYGGDGNASTPTLQSLFNVAPLYMNWMQAWADSQKPDGGMPHTAPNPYKAGGGPYWCGFIITASWQTYLNYGDKRLLERYYPNMQKWLEYAEKYCIEGLLKEWPDEEYRNWYLGDWATPDGIDQTNPQSVYLVNNCFLSECYATMEKIAKLLRKDKDALTYAEQHRQLNRRIHRTFYNTNEHSYSTGTQIDLIYPMLVKATPEENTKDVRATLFKETEEKFKGHLTTGLVGVPIITRWVTEEGEADFMYGMLKKRDYPSYLYMLDNGATTTWEHWNGQRSQIHNCYNGIGSWFIQALAGITPDESAPGYRHTIIRPQMPEGLSWVEAQKDTPYGRLHVAWKRLTSHTQVEITIPTGSSATLWLPQEAEQTTLNGKVVTNPQHISLGSGKHKIIFCHKPKT